MMPEIAACNERLQLCGMVVATRTESIGNQTPAGLRDLINTWGLLRASVKM
jgi:hypothetical protein